MKAMKQEILANGRVRLSAENGVQDTRTGQVYSEAVVKAESVRWFKAYEPTKKGG